MWGKFYHVFALDKRRFDAINTSSTPTLSVKTCSFHRWLCSLLLVDLIWLWCHISICVTIKIINDFVKNKTTWQSTFCDTWGTVSCKQMWDIRPIYKERKSTPYYMGTFFSFANPTRFFKYSTWHLKHTMPPITWTENSIQVELWWIIRFGILSQKWYYNTTRRTSLYIHNTVVDYTASLFRLKIIFFNSPHFE